MTFFFCVPLWRVMVKLYKIIIKFVCIMVLGLLQCSHQSSDPVQFEEIISKAISKQSLTEAVESDFFRSIDDLSILQSYQVQDQIKWYLGYDYAGTVTAFERSQKYIPAIKSIFDQEKDIPSELMYLPLLESGFSPVAVSKSNAKGLWQFVSVTAEELNLMDDSYVDERNDIRKSTKAAVRHLKYLYSVFKNWEFALAAYNGGAGYVKSIMSRNPGMNFWQLAEANKFTRETALYVPRFAALLVIQKNLKTTSIYPKLSDAKFDVLKVTVETPATVSGISKSFGISEKKIREFNPQLKGNVIPPYYKTYSLLIPHSERIAMLR
ncbi:MAG: transglycosylase SLT domain-containing protein [Spirochaetes bacterium]|nr:transglycosylase SLT domain-containing protein [Spirochaetota bacterium]